MNYYQKMFLAGHPIAVECKTEMESYLFLKWAKEQGLKCKTEMESYLFRKWEKGQWVEWPAGGYLLPVRFVYDSDYDGIFCDILTRSPKNKTILPLREFFALATIQYPDWDALPSEFNAITVNSNGDTNKWRAIPKPMVNYSSHIGSNIGYWTNNTCGGAYALANAVSNWQDILVLRPEIPIMLSPAEQAVIDAEKAMAEASRKLAEAKEILEKERGELCTK